MTFYVSVNSENADCLGNEPVLSNGEIIGVTTSGAYGHSVGKSLAFAYVQTKFSTPGTQFEIKILGKNQTATVLKEAAYDPKNLRLRDI